MDEQWKVIPEFPNYQISNLGRVYNSKLFCEMQVSNTGFGHLKICLRSDAENFRYTRSVAQLVAEAFVEPPTDMCDCIVVLDGDFTNLDARNLVWRPRWYAWKYTRQLKDIQPIYMHNLRVRNVTTGVEYESIVEAGITEGLLFEFIWRSTHTGASLFPYSSIFEIIK